MGLNVLSLNFGIMRRSGEMFCRNLLALSKQAADPCPRALILGAVRCAILFTFTVMIVSYTESSNPIERGAFNAT